MDFFDAGVMERLRHQLLNSRASQNRIGLSSLSPCLTVHSQVSLTLLYLLRQHFIVEPILYFIFRY